MFEKLEEVRQRFDQVNSELSDPEVASDVDRLRELSIEYAHLREVVETFQQYRQIEEEIAQNRLLLEDADEAIQQMAREELPSLVARLDALALALKQLLLPKDPLDEKNVLLEIRAGTGGDEAALFAADLFRMYGRYAENRGWRVEILSSNETDRGGFREVIALIDGDRVYSRLKFEAGVHRVQRIPDTESQGRIHTSAVTVAILPEADDVELDVRDQDLKIDTYRSSGPGGQSVNTTDSAIRITHLPTGLVVTCQDEKSQHKNRAKAMKVLKARLLERERETQRLEIEAERRGQVGSGDRSERIRTYNFPQSRVTDHRIGFTTHRLDDIMAGNADEVIEPVIAHFQAEALQSPE
jgi:peptide chain release factor 1